MSNIKHELLRDREQRINLLLKKLIDIVNVEPHNSHRTTMIYLEIVKSIKEIE